MARGRRQGVLIAGGGLAGCLAALALARLRPDVPLLVVEERERFGGERFRFLFRTELDGEARALVAPLVEQAWPGFYVAFPGMTRNLKGELGGFSPPALHRAMMAALKPEQYRLGVKAVAVREDGIVLDGGETIKAQGAIDARGAANLSMLDLLYETRVERVIRLKGPHGLDRPVLVDATLDQGAGFSFVQTFPLGTHRLRIAKALVSERAQPDEAAEARLDHYLTLRGWRTEEVETRTAQSRPLPMGGDFAAFWRLGGARVAKLGLRGGFLQPASGRSVADAARAALLLAEQRDFSGGALHDLFEEQAKQLWKKRDYQRSLVAALAAAKPGERRGLMARLYRLEPGLVTRLHADQAGMIERLRIQRALRP
ncbi:MAG TPA: lycopene beta-cyclase CrtY [Allosphingosinicella sp.]|nr:lycopene beta-cyclase CrtY [Allosphingosinicella sp.]